MPGVVVNGRQELVPGLVVTSYLDDPRLSLGPDDKCARNNRWPRGLCLHVTDGMQAPVRKGTGRRANAGLSTANWWRQKAAGHAGTHLIVDADGSVACLADLLLDCTYHAGSVNHASVGIDLWQPRSPSGLWEGQLDAFVLLCDWLTARLGIQRQFQRVYHGRPIRRIEDGARDVVGIYGHRDVTTARGVDDPGDAPFTWLQQAGYEPLDFGSDDDLRVWKERQRALGGLTVDGVAGPRTVAAVKAMVHADGMWMQR